MNSLEASPLTFRFLEYTRWSYFVRPKQERIQGPLRLRLSSHGSRVVTFIQVRSGLEDCGVSHRYRPAGMLPSQAQKTSLQSVIQSFKCPH
jgi:hypothetical protein